MAATFVTVAELRTNLGIGTLYSDSVVEEVCQSAEDLIKKQLWYNKYPVVGSGIYSGKCYLVLSTSGSFTAGQFVTISGVGNKYNGSYEINATFPWTPGSGSFPYFTFFPFNGLNFPRGYSIISYDNPDMPDDEAYHLVVPYGTVEGTEDGGASTYATTPLIREAAMMIAVDIWQARQTNNAGGISPDFSPSPYRMGASLLSRVSGLLAPYRNPRGMLG